MSRHANTSGGNLQKLQLYRKTHKQLRKAESGRNSLSQRRGYQLLILYKIVSPENICIQVTLHTLQRLDLCIQEHTHQNLKKKKLEVANLGQKGEGVWEGLEGGNRKGKIILVIF